MSTAGLLAKKGMLGLWSATKTGVSAVTDATKKTRDAYNTYQEKDVLAGLRKSGVEPVDLLVASLQKFFYLSAAGYKHELVAAAQAAAARLLAEGSSVQLDTVLIAGRILEEETLKRGSFEKSGFKAKLNDLLKTGRASKEHYDREQLAHDVYYALLLLSEVSGAKGAQLAHSVRGCALRLVESPTPFAPTTAANISIPSFDKSTSSAGNAAAAAVASINVSAHSATPSAPPMSATIAQGGVPETVTPVDEQADPLRYKLVKAVYMVASVLRKEAEAAEERRLKKLRDAEELLRKEQARMHGGI